MRTSGHALRRLAHFGARTLPQVALRRVPPLFGAFFAAILPARRKQVAETLRWITGRNPRHREVVGSFVDYACCVTESLAAGRAEVRVEVVGREHLAALLGQGTEQTGVILATGHVGAWDVVASVLAAQLGHPVTLVMEAEEDAAARRLHDAVRERAGLRIAHVGRDWLDALGLLQQLRQGQVLAFQLDRPTQSGRQLRGDLFGREFGVPEGIFKLAQLSGVPILPVFSRRCGFFEHRVRVFPEIRLSRHAPVSEQQAAAQIALDCLQNFVSEAPRQWFFFHDPPPEP